MLVFRNESFWADELYSTIFLRESFFTKQFWDIWLADVHPPLFAMLVSTFGLFFTSYDEISLLSINLIIFWLGSTAIIFSSSYKKTTLINISIVAIVSTFPFVADYLNEFRSYVLQIILGYFVWKNVLIKDSKSKYIWIILCSLTHIYSLIWAVSIIFHTIVIKIIKKEIGFKVLVETMLMLIVPFLITLFYLNLGIHLAYFKIAAPFDSLKHLLAFPIMITSPSFIALSILVFVFALFKNKNGRQFEQFKNIGISFLPFIIYFALIGSTLLIFDSVFLWKYSASAVYPLAFSCFAVFNQICLKEHLVKKTDISRSKGYRFSIIILIGLILSNIAFPKLSHRPIQETERAISRSCEIAKKYTNGNVVVYTHYKFLYEGSKNIVYQMYSFYFDRYPDCNFMMFNELNTLDKFLLKEERERVFLFVHSTKRTIEYVLNKHTHRAIISDTHLPFKLN